jgi:hypothetical protein
MKARIRLRPNGQHTYTLLGDGIWNWAVIGKDKLKDLASHVDYLRSIGCDTTANKILLSIRVS